MAGKNDKTRPFNAVNRRTARIAREKQKREYEQQKKEKFIFVLFVVIILVMILFAILVFKKILGGESPVESESDTRETVETNDPDGSEDTGDTDTASIPSSYTDIKVPKSDLHAGNLLLIDASHPYQKGTVSVTDIHSSRTEHADASHPRGYVYSYYPADTNVMLETETLAALNALADAFYTATSNNDLFVRPAAAYVESASDEHATGRAVDFSGWSDDDVYYNLDDAKYTAGFEWLRANYYKYGFIRRSDGDGCNSDSAYHFLYVGKAHAYYMYENDLSLEEYVELLRTRHTFTNDGENNLTITTDLGERYEIYYVAAVGDIINLPVPTACEACTYSGDNVSGFIVTVNYGRTYE